LAHRRIEWSLDTSLAVSYDKTMINEINNLLDPDETILWQGGPKYAAYVLRTVPAVLFGLLWSSFLVPFYLAFFSGKIPVFFSFILIPHTLIGLCMLLSPVWASLNYPYIAYAITSKRIIMQGGFFARSFATVDYANLTDVSVRVDLLGKLTGTGDIMFVSGMGIFTEKTGKNALAALEKPYDVFKLLKQVYFDIKTDVEFPNKLRPPANPGYRSEYNPPRA